MARDTSGFLLTCSRRRGAIEQDFTQAFGHRFLYSDLTALLALDGVRSGRTHQPLCPDGVAESFCALYGTQKFLRASRRAKTVVFVVDT